MFTFDGACIKNIYDVNLTSKMAKSLNWKEAPEELAAASAAREGKLIGSWMHMEKESLVIISIGQGQMDNKTIIPALLSLGWLIPRMPFCASKLSIKLNCSSMKQKDINVRTFKFTVSGDDVLVTAMTGVHTSTNQFVTMSA